MPPKLVELAEKLRFALYRFGAFALLSLTDDPALIAMAFC